MSYRSDYSWRKYFAWCLQHTTHGLFGAVYECCLTLRIEAEMRFGKIRRERDELRASRTGDSLVGMFVLFASCGCISKIMGRDDFRSGESVYWLRAIHHQDRSRYTYDDARFLMTVADFVARRVFLYQTFSEAYRAAATFDPSAKHDGKEIMN
jgi:hypothetical protein